MAENNETFDDISQNPRKNRENKSGLQTAIRVLSILPCFPKYEPKPETPNIDQLKAILSKFRNQDANQTDVSVLDRVNSHSLSQWTEKLLTFLPNINDLPDKDSQTAGVVTHFDTIKKFYTTVQNAGFDTTPEMDLFFNSLQIYESIMSIAFVVFQDHPESMKAITDNVTKAIDHVQGYGTQGCCAIAFCGVAILSKFNSILGAIDQKLGELGVVKVADFVTQIIEIFCRFFNIDIRDTEKIQAISESIQDMVKSVSGVLKKIFGDSIPDMDRKKKWGPLSITERIRAKLSKFENQSQIVGRTVNSFEKFFNTVEKIDDNFEDLKINKNTSRAYGSTDEDTDKIEARPLLATQIADKQLSAFEQVTAIGRLFQHLETILFYGVLLFKNEDEVLNPLLDNVDECTRILEKYAGLHPLYKILCGPNYLSKLKVIVKKIANLLESSKLKFNSPREFLAELKQRYPDLLYLLCESYLNDNLKQKLEFLPDPLENALNDAMNGALSKFKNKFKF
ncbi:unnamed protein product [Brachionus calyciflorus]|uniref:Uncharacterized protein n=1 Tax=Brachionus calyciflorus TaxID=104777 RepID=A0A813QFD1_9BILA|nr:unnamed protein product [Brachionus calyciflorus]